MLQLAAPFHPKAARMVRGRKGLWNRIRAVAADHPVPTVLFHCASAGEFEQGRPVIEGFRKRHPSYRIVVSFFSTSGYEQAVDFKYADHIVLLPFDSRSAAGKFVRLINPSIAVFVKYEFWYHIFDHLHKAGTPIFLISAIFRKDQVFFRWYGGLHRKILGMVRHFYVQDDRSGSLLTDIGHGNATVSGDTRYDRVRALADVAFSDKFIERFVGGNDVLVVGSSWPEDMRVVAPLIRDDSLELKYIIAPHEVDEGSIKNVVRQVGMPCYRYSQLADPDDVSTYRVLVIDRVGLLSRIYRYGCMAYVGGGFVQGLHNILEPAVYGLPVFFGKSGDNAKYREAIALLQEGGAFEIDGPDGLSIRVNCLLADRAALRRVGEISRQHVVGNAGATSTILEGLDQMVG
jgi:3-deoxy-D-manno-octulosonic-acid transferase